MAGTFRRFACSAALLLLASGPNAEPPESILGIYTRQTPTCGASGEGRRDCGLVFEDQVEVTVSNSLEESSAKDLFVSLGVHFDLGKNEFCTFRGHGAWANGGVTLGDAENPVKPELVDPACRLALIFSGRTVRVSDPGHKCRASLCTGPQRLDGVSYTKRGIAK